MLCRQNVVKVFAPFMRVISLCQPERCVDSSGRASTGAGATAGRDRRDPSGRRPAPSLRAPGGLRSPFTLNGSASPGLDRRCYPRRSSPRSAQRRSPTAVEVPVTCQRPLTRLDCHGPSGRMEFCQRHRLDRRMKCASSELLRAERPHESALVGL